MTLAAGVARAGFSCDRGAMLRPVLSLALCLAACRTAPGTATPEAPAAGSVQAVSWLGRPLRARTLEPEVRGDFESKLSRALADWEARPDDPEAAVWVGRRLAYLGRYDEAIAVYSDAITRHPDFAPLYRHRGHRHISTRDLAAARADLERAAALIEGSDDVVEQDGLPNARNVPTSTLHTNVWYHLGLVHFLRGDWGEAVHAYRACLAKARNDDMRVATLQWLYMALRRLGRHDEARAAVEPVHADMDVIENTAYHRLTLMYRGMLDAETLEREATGDDVQNPALLYGLANYHLVEGHPQRAYALMQHLVDSARWDAFGTIAAEADLARRNPLPAAADVADAPAFDATAQLAPWLDAWNRHDLDAVTAQFVADDRLTYYSSEKPGRLRGPDALAAHHRGFDFVAGGTTPDPSKTLWLDDVLAQPHGDATVVTATWYFGDRTASDPQHGPVTFVFVHDDGGWQIAHAHFADAPAAGK